MRAVARAIIGLRMRLRFRIWVARTHLELRRFGGTLIVDAPYAVHFDEAPVIRAFPDGDGSAVTTLRFGRDARIGRNLTIELFARGENHFEVGDTARVLNNVRVILRSGSVRFGSECLVRDGVWIKSDGAFVAGDGVTLGPYSAIHCAGSVTFDDLVGLAERVSVIDSEHTFDGTDAHYMRNPLTVTPVSLGRQTMIAAGAVVLRGTTIGQNSVVASNALVRTGEYPAGSVLVGNPARVVKRLVE